MGRCGGRGEGAGGEAEWGPSQRFLEREHGRFAPPPARQDVRLYNKSNIPETIAILMMIVCRYALGEMAMRRIRTSQVLISGIGPVGVEIAKNLILGGIRHVTVQDTKLTEWNDLSAQYYLNSASIGKNRAEASFGDLEELNDGVVVQCFTQPLTEQTVAKHDVSIPGILHNQRKEMDRTGH